MTCSFAGPVLLSTGYGVPYGTPRAHPRAARTHSLTCDTVLALTRGILEKYPSPNTVAPVLFLSLRASGGPTVLSISISLFHGLEAILLCQGVGPGLLQEKKETSSLHLQTLTDEPAAGAVGVGATGETVGLDPSSSAAKPWRL